MTDSLLDQLLNNAAATASTKSYERRSPRIIKSDDDDDTFFPSKPVLNVDSKPILNVDSLLKRPTITNTSGSSIVPSSRITPKADNDKSNNELLIAIQKLEEKLDNYISKTKTMEKLINELTNQKDLYKLIINHINESTSKILSSIDNKRDPTLDIREMVSEGTCVVFTRDQDLLDAEDENKIQIIKEKTIHVFKATNDSAMLSDVEESKDF
jgi:hypothetical protein